MADEQPRKRRVRETVLAAIPLATVLVGLIRELIWIVRTLWDAQERLSDQDRIDRLDKRLAELEEALGNTDAELRRHAEIRRCEALHTAIAKAERRREAARWGARQ
jgi:hypothetical protein